MAAADLNGYHQLTYDVLLALPEAEVLAHPRTAHQAELVGSLAVGKVPVPVPTVAREIRATLQSDGGEDALHRTFLAMAARRRHGRNVDAHAVAVRTRPLASAIRNASGGPGRGFLPFWHLGAGIACHLAGDAAGAKLHYRAAWSDRDADDLGVVGVQAAAALGVLTAVRGEAAEARRWLGETEPDCPPPPAVAESLQHARGLVRSVLATDAFALDDVAGPGDRLDEVFSRNPYWPFSFWAEARLAITEGRAGEALALLDDAEAAAPETAQSDGIHPRLLAAARAELRLALGHGTRACALLGSFRSDDPVGWVPRARLHLLSGEPEQAIAVAAQNATDPYLAPRDRTELLLVKAAAAVTLGQHELARTTAATATALATARGDLRAFTTVPRAALEEVASGLPQLTEQLRFLDERGVPPAYPDRVRVVALTDRERTVLEALARGVGQDDLAQELFLSRNTVKSHVRSLYAKLDVHSRADALIAAGRLGLLGEGRTGPA